MFHLFDGVPCKKQNIAAKLSSVLGFPVNKESNASSVLYMNVEGIGQI